MPEQELLEEDAYPHETPTTAARDAETDTSRETDTSDDELADPSAWVSMAAGGLHSCGLRGDDTIQCWGLDDHGQVAAPGGAFQSISARSWHTCGIRTNGTAECWGNNIWGQARAPGGAFESISAGFEHTCGLRADGTAECWGRNDSGQANTPGGTFTSISAGFAHTCGLTVEGAVECWGLNDAGQSDAPDGVFASVSTWAWTTCALRAEGTAECWGANESGQADAPSGAFESIDPGGSHTCGLRDDRTVECWGANDAGQSHAPSGDLCWCLSAQRTPAVYEPTGPANVGASTTTDSLTFQTTRGAVSRATRSWRQVGGRRYPLEGWRLYTTPPRPRWGAGRRPRTHQPPRVAATRLTSVKWPTHWGRIPKARVTKPVRTSAADTEVGGLMGDVVSKPASCGGVSTHM